MAPRIQIIVILNVLWSEFDETNERRFDDLLLQIFYHDPIQSMFKMTTSALRISLATLMNYGKLLSSLLKLLRHDLRVPVGSLSRFKLSLPQ